MFTRSLVTLCVSPKARKIGLPQTCHKVEWFELFPDDPLARGSLQLNCVLFSLSLAEFST